MTHLRYLELCARVIGRGAAHAFASGRDIRNANGEHIGIDDAAGVAAVEAYGRWIATSDGRDLIANAVRELDKG